MPHQEGDAGGETEAERRGGYPTTDRLVLERLHRAYRHIGAHGTYRDMHVVRVYPVDVPNKSWGSECTEARQGPTMWGTSTSLFASSFPARAVD